MWSDIIGLIHSWHESMDGGGNVKIETEHIPDPPEPNHKEQSEKLDLSLVSVIAIAHEAAALTVGARKYGRENYKQSLVNTNVYLAAALRHISLWQSGQDIDEDGVNHLGAARADLGVLLDAWENGNLIDNRIDSCYPDVLAQLNEWVQPQEYELTEAGQELLDRLGDEGV